MVTLSKYLKKLTKNEKAIICNAMRQHGGFPDCHGGLLPFLKMDGVIIALQYLFTQQPMRVIANLLTKLSKDHTAYCLTVIDLYLDDAKLYRRFRSLHKDKIIARIPGMPQVNRTAGVSYNIGKKDYVPHPVTVPLEAALHRIGKNHWVMTVEKEGRERAATWLLDNCGV